ncbi:hypothetical protein GS429_02320 [Natronorubrum sp. JWXQ-INN-674]|uniref:Uncharacterized protein n=1 Tax=Natronorubrum halalkaliphilum TaxID=2691917 RepID=A0A6B0VJ04_9EURY|nr:hypothetical protein [Natronorubrum halalkaliphilum]MXV60926.1 hypothetical protein [Natronorubrum halalkaliphilum]
MDTARLYYGSTILCCVVAGAMGLSSVAAGDAGIADALMATAASERSLLRFTEDSRRKPRSLGWG